METQLKSVISRKNSVQCKDNLDKIKQNQVVQGKEIDDNIRQTLPVQYTEKSDRRKPNQGSSIDEHSEYQHEIRHYYQQQPLLYDNNYSPDKSKIERYDIEHIHKTAADRS